MTVVKPGQRADLDEHREPGHADDVDGLGDRVRDVELGVGHQARHHGRHQHIEDRADHERAENADRHVALRQFGFLRGGRDGVKADEGEEHDRGAAHHA